MKKAVIIISIILLLLISTLFVVPVFFKQNILDATQETINKRIDAQVEFANFKLSLFKNFPKATIELKEVRIIGENEFQNDTLLNVLSAKATISLSSLFKSTGIQIEEVALEKPEIVMLVNETGKNNWDIVSESSSIEVSKELPDSENSFKLQLDKFEINNAVFSYEDRSSDLLFNLTDLDFDISGKMYGTTTELETEGKVGNVLFQYDKINYISNVELGMKTLLNVDYQSMKISIAENELMLNRLPLELTGDIEIPSDSIFIDIQINTKESDFENFLALIPPAYEEYLKEIKSTGTATIAGNINGIYYNENYPAFSLKLDVKEGNIQYADLPEQIQNIKADVEIIKPQGDLDLTEVLVKDAHAEVKNNPVDLTLKMNHLMSDPSFDGAFVGKVNLDHLKDALPFDSVNISGTIDASLFVKGNYSAIEEEQYEKLNSDGIVLLDNFIYDSPDLTQKIIVPKGQLVFSPENINLQEFNMKVGQSDFRLSGKVSNYLNYILKDGILKGNLQLNSNLVNLNELLRLQVQEKKEVIKDEANLEKSVGEPEVLAFDIPENIDVTFQSKVKNAVFDRVPISDINGLITASKGKLMLNGLNMKMLDGELNLTGSYQNTPQNNPLVDFGFDILSFDIPVAYRSLSGMQQMIPVAGQSRGEFSSSIKMKGQLNANHKLVPSSVDGDGLFSTKDLEILNSPIFNQLKGILKSEKLQDVAIADFKANFIIDKGNINLRPFKTKIADQETQVSGSLNADNLLNMRLDFKIQREAFGPDIQNILNILPGNEKITLVPAGVIINGPVKDPAVKMDLSETRKTITNATKDDLQNTLDQLGRGLKKLFEK